MNSAAEFREQTGLPAQNWPRLVKILGVAAAGGWRHYVERMRLGGHLPGAGAVVEGVGDARRLCIALQELGPAFVKFGQVLSVRQDLLPPQIIEELQKLQDAVPPFPGEEARRIVEAELGRPVSELFAEFDPSPLAAASMAQVHGATLRDGTEVVVKVQRPGIADLIYSDLAILFFCARLLRDHVPESRRYQLPQLVEEFADTIGRELDFLEEGRNADRFRENFRDEPAVYVPRVFWELSARRVLTMERSAGHRAGPDYPQQAEQRQRMGNLVARLFLVQLFEHGLFHGDPHPGNVFIMRDGRLCFHDFGIVGRLSRREQENLRQLFLALLIRDAEWMTDIYFDMGVATEDVDRQAFARDLHESLEQYYAVADRGYSFAEILNQFIRLGQRHQIRMPREMLLVAKAFMAIESQARALDPKFDMIAAWRTYAPHLIRRELLPEFGGTEVLARGYRAWNTLRSAALALPQTLSAALRQLQKGEVSLRVRHEPLGGLEQRIERASNRLSFSLIIAAIVIASSILMSNHSGPHLEGLPLLGLIGYAVAAVLGLWWAVAVLRSGKL